MSRVMCRCSLLIVYIIYGLYSFWIVSVFADCWYENEKYDEGVEVATAEACLNCTCSRGTLLCYLRICPNLPDPPPPGCILLHRYRTCCPELICTDLPGGNGLEGRSESSGLDLLEDTRAVGSACVANGTVFAPGSAMDSSSNCEFCYCLAGRETCVKPKCLLPTDGCVPIFDRNNCCPVRYNCTSSQKTKTASTTTVKTNDISNRGCKIYDVYYPEGGKVLGVGHSVCDNCYCLGGILRCEPLSCAPPLLGCIPIIRPGECCAASYNCSGTIEIQPEPNYGHYPTVSKEYAKLRKEVQQTRSTTKTNNKHKSVTENTNIPFYVIAETLKSTTFHRTPGTFGTTRQFSGISYNTSTPKPQLMIKIKQTTLTNNTTIKPNSTIIQNNKNNYINSESSDLLILNNNTEFNPSDGVLDARLNRKVKNETEEETTTEYVTESTTVTDLDNDLNSTFEFEDVTFEATTNTDPEIYQETTEIAATETTENQSNDYNDPSFVVTLKTILNSTDCNTVKREQDFDLVDATTTILPIDANEVNKLAIVKNYLEYTTDESEESTTDYIQDDITEVNLESRVKVGSSDLKNNLEMPVNIKAISLNLTKNKDDFGEYDYNEPSLPPSLPNLRIIPFVAADALDSKTETSKGNAMYSLERIPDPAQYPFPQWFNPPAETEGGFIPKTPPILEKKPNEINCVSADGLVTVHGEIVPSELPCTICNCHYGNIVCRKEECEFVNPECTRIRPQENNSCCPQYVCDEKESPTLVLDSLEGTQEVVTVPEKIITSDPFRHVIRTEPAPDLQSLIGDLKPFLTKKPSSPTTKQPSTQAIKTTTPKINAGDSDKSEFSLEKVFQFLLSGESESHNEEKTPPKQNVSQKTDVPNHTINVNTEAPFNSDFNFDSSQKNENSENGNSSNAVASVEENASKFNKTGLVIAGCNIYGRMYRVERIISELSNPCLECKCTQGGVQCRALKCSNENFS